MIRRGTERVEEVGAKGVGKGLAQELIHADAFSPAFFSGRWPIGAG